MDKQTPLKRYGINLLAGGLATLAMPPLHIFPVLFVSFYILVSSLNSCKTPLQSFLTGWVFGFGYFLLGIYWTPFALFDDLAKWWWAILVLLVALPLALSFFSGALVGLFYALQSRKTGLPSLLIFAALWAIMEWIRGHIFTGFPWNLVGYTWGSTLILQITSVIGIFGLSLLTTLFCALPVLWQSGQKRQALAVASLLTLLVCGFGTWRLSGAEVTYHPDITLRIVQANTNEKNKWAEPYKRHNFKTHIEESLKPGDFDYLIWPEVALSYREFKTDRYLYDALVDVVPKNGHLLSGWMPRAEDVNDRDFYNAMIVLDENLETIAQHRKFHLIPMGEYALFKNIFKNSRAIAVHKADTVAGPGPSTLHVPGLPAFSPLICYEIIFPGAVTNRNDPPQWLLNLTNDAWFGRTAGPHQHFAIARVRAIEEGLPLVRAAISGISGLVDPYGEVLKTLPLKHQGVLDIHLPKSLKSKTIYSEWVDIPFGILLLCFLMLGWFCKPIHKYS